MTRHIALEPILRTVQKPGRYTGGEWNSIRKDPARVEVMVALAFPDLYEVGMSYLGQKILYHILNSRPDVLTERVFAPWPDFERALRANNLPLCSLENRIPLDEFDLLGFSLLYELNYSNLLTMLDLGGIPLRSCERTGEHPLIAAGGPAAFNPEPLAEICDFFLIGDGEEAFPEIIETWQSVKSRNPTRRAVLEELSRLPGVYVPSGGPDAIIDKRVCRPFAQAPFPEDIIVPNIQIIHDRAIVEVERGCPQNCRFCQARTIYFPARPKDPAFVMDRMRNSVDSTGYENASLAALSVGDYPYLEHILEPLMEELGRTRTALSLPSLRPGGLTPEVVAQILRVRKTGFTLVPEAGTDRLRRVINKHLTHGDIIQAAERAFRHGWQRLKLYFMVGLPTETEEDIDGIAELILEVLRLGNSLLGRPPHINLSVASFIPKPHTPFQWLPMADEEELREKYRRLKSLLRRHRSVRFKEHGIKSSLLEAVFSRGDRRLNQVLIQTWRAGARFDSWNEHFRWDLWQEIFRGEDIDYRSYLGALDRDDPLPWDHIRTGVHKSHLLSELDRALEAQPTQPCQPRQCRECGGCEFGYHEEALGDPNWKRTPRPERPSGWERSDEEIRYRVTYEKAGLARFISHNDLVNCLQRGFRRARIPVVFSQGFHPKMRMSFAPALALGMRGLREMLDFRSFFEMGSQEFCTRVNGRLPEGIRILDLERLGEDAEQLSRVTGLEYSVDLADDEIQEEVKRMRRDIPKYAGLSIHEIVEGRIREYFTNGVQHDGDRVSCDLRNGKLLITIRTDSTRSVRAQDVLAGLFGCPHPAFLLTRERLRFPS